MHYRRLEKGTFYWPTKHPSVPLTISRRKLRWLLDGFTFQQKQGHQVVHARTIL
ncbi:IS66 family insertion sequence element accessory protein TnpB [Bacillus cereus group sp. BfR-BA-01380]|uniref:IS66 family insertion sequence element accessory protein TnpB n=1 Tax=Bacillus cereus group sp. BfR-BA-01380 TaxID=2920324 RepID=UPI0037BF08A0